MKFNLDTARVFIPDGLTPEVALGRTTHLAIGAHQDDLEIMAIDGILQCFQQEKRWFSGVIVTNGSGSPRDDLYKNYTDDEMRAVRVKEQQKAAIVGEYSAQVLLDYPSSALKDVNNKQPVEDITRILELASPDVVYTHNLVDKHDTHISVALRLIEAARRLPADKRPKHLYGCEVWRDLDWMPDEDKVAFDVSRHENLQAALLGIFDSQICGGKRYDLASMGRRRANATYFSSHGVDTTTGMTIAMDLTPLIEDPSINILAYLDKYLDRFRHDVHQRIERLGKK